MGRRIAFLVGNQVFRDDSGLSSLRGPLNDVTALARVLRDPERGRFDPVQEFADQPHYEILPIIEEELHSTGGGDLVLIFYAGHGKPDGSGDLHLATANTRERALSSTSIPAWMLQKFVRDSDCGQVVLLLDCCYSGSVSRRGAINDQLQVLKNAAGFYILTASTSTQTAGEAEADRDGQIFGRFTRAFVDGVESGEADYDRDGQILLSEIKRHLDETVHGQTPQFFAYEGQGDPLISLAPFRTRMRRLPQLPAVVRASLDSLPINPQLTITGISYGEGAQRQTVNLDQLYVLPAETKFVADDGTRVPLVELALSQQEVELALSQQGELDAIPSTKKIFAPAVITINGRKFGEAQKHPALVHIYTDAVYLGKHPRNQSNQSFQAICRVGMQGIAAFVDNFGNLRPPSPFEIGHGLGCVAVIFAVSYAGGTPAFRSSGILLIRKGIRYPDDIWLSGRTGRPICSVTDDISNGRFIFQSRESKGESCDIFVANYNGEKMCNINLKEESAWDGFHDDSGQEVAGWTDDGQVRYCTRSGGFGRGIVVTRPDCKD